MLGRTGLSVSELSMGGLFVASFAGEFEQARAAVKRAAELGINYIDTAPGYGNSEENVGRILPEIEPPLIVSTKLGGRPQPFLPRLDGSVFPCHRARVASGTAGASARRPLLGGAGENGGALRAGRSPGKTRQCGR